MRHVACGELPKLFILKDDEGDLLVTCSQCGELIGILDFAMAEAN